MLPSNKEMPLQSPSTAKYHLHRNASDGNIIDYCHIHGEKDIKTCTITFYPLKNKNMKRKLPSLVADFAINTLGLEEVFIDVDENDKSMIKYLETFLPFVNGISDSLMPLVRDTLIENEDEVYIIYVYNKEISVNLALKKKKFNVRDHIDKTVPNLPKELGKKLQDNLKQIKRKIE